LFLAFSLANNHDIFITCANRGGSVPHCNSKGLTMPTEIDVLKAKTEMLEYLTDESCTMDPQLAAALGVSADQQVRLQVKATPAKYGLVTVHSLYEDGTDNDDVRLRASARARFDETDGFEAYVDTACVLQGKTDQWLNDNDEFGELLNETDSSHTDVVFCAPHGGMIENHTDEMAKWAYDRMVSQSKSASCWRCIGHQDSIGAYNAWHITSSDISRTSFPKLDEIGDRAFSHAVSFHGFGEADIAIGGNASTAVKNAVKSAIESVVGTTYDVEIITTGPYAGTDPDNFVNWLTDGSGGVQIELPLGARSTYGQAIAEAVADVFAAYQ